MNNDDKIEWLTELCSDIYGSEHWKTKLADHLEINVLSVNQWADGERTIPDIVVRGILSLAHGRASAIARHAERVALDMKNKSGYQRIIYQSGLHLEELRRDLYTENRAWFDVDGQLFALNESGVVHDVHGYETTWAGASILPDGVTVSDLVRARDLYIDENGNYD